MKREIVITASMYSDLKLSRMAIEAFRRVNRDVILRIVENVPFSSSPGGLLNLDNVGADIMLVDMEEVKPLAEKKLIADLSGYFKYAERNRYSAPLFGKCVVNGSVYGVPFDAITYNMAYRADLFRKYGFSRPFSWDSFIKNALYIMSREKNIKHGLQYDALGATGAKTFALFTAAYTGDLVNIFRNITDMKVYEEVMKKIASAVQAGLIPRENITMTTEEKRGLYVSGKALASLYWDFDAAALPREIIGKTRLTGMPTMKYGGIPPTIVRATAFVVSTSTKYPTYCAAFISAMTEKKFNRSFNEAKGFKVLSAVPAVNNLLGKEHLPCVYEGANENLEGAVFEKSYLEDMNAAMVMAKSLNAVIRDGALEKKDRKEAEEGLVYWRRTSLHTYSVEKAVLFMKSNFDKRLERKAISAASGLSDSYFAKVFREKTGRKVMDFLLEIRIEMAKRLIGENREINISQASYRCGFPDEKHFSKVFKRFSGMTPTEFKQKVLIEKL